MITPYTGKRLYCRYRFDFRSTFIRICAARNLSGKMLVDMYCDKLISSAYSKSEYPEVLRQAMETYHIESTKMMRYARRRGREDEMKKILEEIEAAEA